MSRQIVRAIEILSLCTLGGAMIQLAWQFIVLPKWQAQLLRNVNNLVVPTAHEQQLLEEFIFWGVTIPFWSLVIVVLVSSVCICTHAFVGENKRWIAVWVVNIALAVVGIVNSLWLALQMFD